NITIGTFIKHPNRSDFYLTTIRDSAVPDCRATLTYSPKRGLSTFGNSYRNLVDLTPEIEEDLRRVFGWHDSIASLPQMDPNWAYQIEFGLCPPMLFQVRPFRKVQFADFSFDSHVGGPWVPAVIGVTGEEGEDYEVISDSISSPKSTLPILYLADLHDFNPMRLQIDKEPNGYIFYDGGGILAHGDVKAMRRSKLTIIYPMFQPGYLDGKIVNIRSQGREIKIKNKETGEEFV
ncbi:hypothetical protein M1437_03095, partial [Patescibacteria group bacterium]|nr:hypothetical protein [Patescibacteria group bacterium]